MQAGHDAANALKYGTLLGLPKGTIIYYAVDCDPLDDEITKYIIPYFEEIKKASFYLKYEELFLFMFKIGYMKKDNENIKKEEKHFNDEDITKFINSLPFSLTDSQNEALDLILKDLKELFYKTIKSISSALDSKDPYTHGHSLRVTLYSLILAKEMGFDEKLLEEIETAGLLHDIGRKFGVKHLGHVYDGWKYMMELNYDEAARICLSHSFNEGDLNGYIGNFDITEEQTEEIRQALSQIELDDYDRLIQLCDSIAGAEGVMKMEERMLDVKRRYGNFPQSKWDKNLELKAYFEHKARNDIYRIVADGSLLHNGE